MSRYVDADSIEQLKPIDKWERDYQTFNCDDAYEMGWYDLDSKIRALPTVDAVEVVRCKDCMYGVQEELFDLDGVNHRSTEWHCVKNDLSVVDDWFCADGEMVSE